MFQAICCRIKVQLYNKNFCFSTVYMNDAILVWLSVPEAKGKVFILGGPHPPPLSIIYLSDPSEKCLICAWLVRDWIWQYNETQAGHDRVSIQSVMEKVALSLKNQNHRLSVSIWILANRDTGTPSATWNTFHQLSWVCHACPSSVELNQLQ